MILAEFVADRKYIEKKTPENQKNQSIPIIFAEQINGKSEDVRHK